MTELFPSSAWVAKRIISGVIPTAAYTTQVWGPVLDTRRYSSILAILDVSVVPGAGGLSVRLSTYVAGTRLVLNPTWATKVTAIGQYGYIFAPMAGALNNSTASGAPADDWFHGAVSAWLGEDSQLVVSPSTADPYTYGLSCVLLP